MTFTTGFIRRAAMAMAIATGAGHAAAQDPLTSRCESAPIMSLFKVFGDTGRMPPDLGRFLQSAALQKIEPYKAFDNVYYVDICWVSAWLITSPKGHVLIDALYGPYPAPMLDNIRQLGFDPQDIRQVVLTHGHFDHAGGAATLKAALPDARFAMTAEGWREAAESAVLSASRPDRWTMIDKDTTLTDGQVLQVGDIRLQAFETPGHTMGTASFSFDGYDGGKRYRAFTAGDPGPGRSIQDEERDSQCHRLVLIGVSRPASAQQSSSVTSPPAKSSRRCLPDAGAGEPSGTRIACWRRCSRAPQWS